MSTELTPEEMLALADDNYVGWEEDAREALRDAAVNARLQRERAAVAPPRIEDMAPGTTFNADTIATRYGSRWTVLPSGRVESGMGIGHEASEIDPSTIRNVQPPARREED